MNSDCVFHLFKIASPETKLPLSIVCKSVYQLSRNYVRNINAAVQDGDVFSIVNTPNWYNKITGFDVGLIGSIRMMEIFRSYHPHLDGIISGACEKNHSDMLFHLIKDDDRACHTLFCYACNTGKMDLVELAIEHGADDWNAGLSNACYGDYPEISNYMICLGADTCYCGRAAGAHH